MLNVCEIFEFAIQWKINKFINSCYGYSQGVY